jgi:hypothetical protein
MSLDKPKWEPTQEEVAIRLLARTRIPNGKYEGKFTTETQPTAAQVEKIIEQAVQILRPRLGETAEHLEDQARILCTLRAAFMIELSFFSEQTETHMSPYMALRAEFKEEFENWDIAATGLEPNSESKLSSMHVGTEFPGYATQTF